MSSFFRSILCLLLLTPIGSGAQSLTLHTPVNAPFDPKTYKPLDAHERWRRWWREDGGSPTLHVNAWMIASISQADNNPYPWGRTTGGFTRRIGSNYAGFFTGGSIHEGLAATLGTDPRYFPCACTGLFRRGGHAIEMTFLTYNHSGQKLPDLPQLSGIYGGSMIGKLWYPPQYSPFVQGVQFGHIELGIIGVVHEVQEFSPELKAFFHVRKTHPAAP
ncbi:MAG: hypothetical protein ACLPXT_00160 [Terracidiphilus sp.]